MPRATLPGDKKQATWTAPWSPAVIQTGPQGGWWLCRQTLGLCPLSPHPSGLEDAGTQLLASSRERAGNRWDNRWTLGVSCWTEPAVLGFRMHKDLLKVPSTQHFSAPPPPRPPNTTWLVMLIIFRGVYIFSPFKELELIVPFCPLVQRSSINDSQGRKLSGCTIQP